MAPTILIAGATGNTGRAVVESLPTFIKSSKFLATYRIIALTRSLSSPVAQHLAETPGVTVLEQNWVEITASWLRDHEVERIFIASHNQPNQFAEESQFLVNALKAGVKYVVRISTTAANVRPDNLAYYPRNHWAIEALLSSPEFAALQWTSLQPNIFTQMFLLPIAHFIKEYRKTGKQGKISLLIDAHTPVGLIDSKEVGTIAAHLLSQDSTTPHNKRKYVLNGPNTTGSEIIRLVESYIGTTVENVKYKDLDFIHDMATQSVESRNVMLSIKYAADDVWAGKAGEETTSEEIRRMGDVAPKRTVEDVLKDLLKD